MHNSFDINGLLYVCRCLWSRIWKTHND